MLVGRISKIFCVDSKDIFLKVGLKTGNRLLDFGRNPDINLDPGVFRVLVKNEDEILVTITIACRPSLL